MGTAIQELGGVLLYVGVVGAIALIGEGVRYARESINRKRKSCLPNGS